ncbi:MAG: O-antigen ligase family protein, partial [Ilumatobacteraceae bacterium]
ADASAAGGATRLDEWRVGLATLVQHPLTGAGPEGYRVVFRDGVDAEYEREHGRAVQPDRAHNGLLDVALAGGVPAALLYGTFVVVAAVEVRRRTRGRALSAPLLGVLAGIGAYLTQQQLLFPLAEIEPVLFLLAGGVVCSGRPPWPASRAASRAVATLAAAVAAGGLWWGIRDVAAWHSAHDATVAAAQGDALAAHARAADALRWRSDEVWLHLLSARTAPSPSAALAAVDDALALSPGDPIALQRRQELLVNLDPAAAFEELHDLVAADPHNAALQLLYGTAAIRTDDEAIAEQAWLRAFDLAPDSPGPRQNLITLYRRQGRDAEADSLEISGNR